MSLKLLPQEQKYAFVKKKHLALKWVINPLQHYLLWASFTPLTDQVVLMWLHVMREAKPRLTCWYPALQPCSFHICRWLGAAYAKVDFLWEGGWLDTEEWVKDSTLGVRCVTE